MAEMYAIVVADGEHTTTGIGMAARKAVRGSALRASKIVKTAE
jgi:hypothetical protein